MRRTIYCTAGVETDQSALFLFFVLYLEMEHIIYLLNQYTAGELIHRLIREVG